MTNCTRCGKDNFVMYCKNCDSESLIVQKRVEELEAELRDNIVLFQKIATVLDMTAGTEIRPNIIPDIEGLKRSLDLNRGLSRDLTTCLEKRNAKISNQQKQIDSLQKQLPKGMEHCTILFKECSFGHGWLTAENWIQHECPTCEMQEKLKQIDELKKDNENYFECCNMQRSSINKLQHERSFLKSKINELQSKIDNFGGALLDAKEARQLAEQRLVDSTIKIDELTKENQDLITKLYNILQVNESKITTGKYQERLKQLGAKLDAGREAGEIVNDCISLFDVVKSLLKEIQSCHVIVKSAGLKSESEICLGIESNEKKIQNNVAGKIEEHISRNGDSENLKNMTIPHQNIRLDSCSHKQSSMEKLKNLACAKGVKLCLSQDSSMDTIKTTQNLSLLCGSALLVMDSYIGNLNEALQKLREAGVIV